MKLTDMRPGDMGVILAVPTVLSRLQLQAGEKVRLITATEELAMIEAGGVRLALAATVARQMILAAYCK